MSDLGLMLVQNQASLADFSERVDWLDQMLSRQKLEAIDLVSLPELFCSGYNIGSAIYVKNNEIIVMSNPPAP